MKTTKHDERFFESTRGRVVVMLRGAELTVEELAAELELTNNAVRAHLSTLERDGLVRRKGVRRGFRKPHHTYALTHEAERLFPKAYDALLNQLITTLKGRLSPAELSGVLREVGRALAGAHGAGGKASRERRAQRAVEALAALGGAARVEREGGRLYIRGASCPLAAAVAEHPEVCRLAEAFVAELVGARVREHCERGDSPKCCFELKSAE
ncbi:MAG TPA: ArsR family transcriptional regulator [Pyrinomonadaceae bacterium]|nr:ArsR family transcriptional regulator [Pyrinomonadaceae bacterium]